jgi:hypothetical protein
MNTETNPIALSQHSAMVLLSTIRSLVEVLPYMPINKVEAATQKLNSEIDKLSDVVESILQRAQHYGLPDNGIMQAGMWSFEHGGMFAGTYQNDRVYIGGIWDPTSFDQARFDRAVLTTDYPRDGGSAWLGADRTLLSFLRTSVGRHPAFVQYEQRMRPDSLKDAPFVMVRFVPNKK